MNPRDHLSDLVAHLNAQPHLAKDVGAPVLFVLEDATDGGRFLIDCTKAPVALEDVDAAYRPPSTGVTVTASKATFAQVIAEPAKVMGLYLSGQVRVTGNVVALAKVARAIRS